MDGEQAPAATDLVELVDVESELDDESEFDDSEDDYSDLGQGDDETAAARDESLPERGCQHYRRGCKLVAPCCGEAFWCRFCHDAAKEEGEQAAGAVPHKLDRHAVTQVECGSCNLRQPVAQVCTNKSCGISFGNYFCRICNFFDDDLEKEPFHCIGCGICRVGGRDKFFHCDTCGCCYAVELRNNHRCIQGSMHQNCPVCQENLFNSTSECRVLRCGHTMHRDCLRALVSKAHLARCPLCAVSITDSMAAWAQMDADIARSIMPEEYRDQSVAVLCNDCHATGTTAFHVLGLKCLACGSYNTRRT